MKRKEPESQAPFFFLRFRLYLLIDPAKGLAGLIGRGQSESAIRDPEKRHDGNTISSPVDVRAPHERPAPARGQLA
jgi:hypothetical protein